MTDIQLYTKLSRLPSNLKQEVSNYIDFMKFKSVKNSMKLKKRILGQAKGLIPMKENFEDPIEGFNEYR